MWPVVTKESCPAKSQDCGDESSGMNNCWVSGGELPFMVRCVPDVLRYRQEHVWGRKGEDELSVVCVNSGMRTHVRNITLLRGRTEEGQALRDTSGGSAWGRCVFHACHLMWLIISIGSKLLLCWATGFCTHKDGVVPWKVEEDEDWCLVMCLYL